MLNCIMVFSMTTTPEMLVFRISAFCHCWTVVYYKSCCVLKLKPINKRSLCLKKDSADLFWSFSYLISIKSAKWFLMKALSNWMCLQGNLWIYFNTPSWWKSSPTHDKPTWSIFSSIKHPNTACPREQLLPPIRFTVQFKALKTSLSSAVILL